MYELPPISRAQTFRNIAHGPARYSRRVVNDLVKLYGVTRARLGSIIIRSCLYFISTIR